MNQCIYLNQPLMNITFVFIWTIGVLLSMLCLLLFAVINDSLSRNASAKPTDQHLSSYILIYSFFWQSSSD